MANLNPLLDIYRSAWVDHDRSWLTSWRFTVPAATAQRMSTEVAIVLSLCVPPAFIIVRRFSLALISLVRSCIRLLAARFRRSRQHNVNASSTQIPLQNVGASGNTTSLQQALNSIGDEDNPIRAMQSLYTGLRDVRETEDSISKELKIVITRDIPSVLRRFLEDPFLALSVFLVSILIVGLTMSIIYLGISAAGIDSDNLGGRIGRRPVFLSNSEPVWWLSDNIIDKMMLSDRGWLAEEQGDKCYQDSNHEKDCTLLLPSKQIPLVTPWYYSSCPFDGDVCVEGYEGITLMTTGLVDSKVLGINTKASNRFAFERNMTCAPLVNDDRYQEYKADAWTFKYEVDHQERRHYAAKAPGSSGFDYRNVPLDLSSPFLITAPPAHFENRYETWVAKFDPFLATHPSGAPRFPDDLHLSPQFRSGNNSVTLLFIASPNAVLHSYERDDIVFPATTALSVPAGQPNAERYWYNNSTRAGVLGCVDSFRICDLTGSTCWDQGQLMSNSDSAQGYDSPRMTIPSTLPEQQRYPFFLLMASLIRSTAFDAMYSMSNKVLQFNKDQDDASDNWTSGKQWEKEAQKMFKTSLARVQVDMLYLSLGHTFPFHSEENLDKAPETIEDMDTSFVFPALGNRNVDALWFVSINLLCFLVFLSSRRYSTPEKRRANIEGGLDGGYHDDLWITVFFKILRSFVSWVWHTAIRFIKILWSWISTIWSMINKR